MNSAEKPAQTIEAVWNELVSLRHSIISDAALLGARLGHARNDDSAMLNLAHYLALRRHDLRPLQRELMWRGLSSLGRLESRVLPALDAVMASLAALMNRESPFPAPTREEFFAGEERLNQATDDLFGPAPPNRHNRIMVTLSSEAALDAAAVERMARSGMDIARINCAHDDAPAWRAMMNNVHAAGNATGRRISILMDIAGPKIRTEAVLTPNKHAKLKAGDALRLVASGAPRTDENILFSAVVSFPEMVLRLLPGDRLRYDDGKLEGTVETAGAGEAIVRVNKTKADGVKLKSGKGINLPDTALGLSPLTAKDEDDLSSVIYGADMIGYSFVTHPGDIDLLEQALARRGANGRVLGLVAKIERAEAVKNLPDLIARASGGRPFGVMIARGDLAAEIGFERLAEMQEEILWICEAAGVPVIWATQVLENLVKDGIPSRGEMTDAAMAARAECVMLNKGPEIDTALSVLDRLLVRMHGHILKKTPTLRALKSW